MKDTPKPPDDALTAQLRAAVRSRRPLSISRVLFLLGLLLAPVVALILYYQPRPRDLPVVAITFDALVASGEETDLVARVFSADPEEANVRLDGRGLIFEPAAGEGQRVSAETDVKGIARAKWKPAEKNSEFLIRWPEGRIADQARIFSLPAAANLVLVDVETTLTSAELQTWKTENILDIPSVAQAQKALRALAEKDNEVIYLAVAAGEPYVHRKVRGWMDNRFAEDWPIGPVIGRVNYDAEQNAEYASALTRIRKKFSGSIRLVVSNKDVAKLAADLKLTTYLLGEHEALPGCVVLRDWPALEEHLAKK